jgi:putative ABC transport system permease protein
MQFLVVASAAAILMMSISLEQSINSSYDRAHDEANGAHVWFGAGTEDAARAVKDMPQVVESTEIYEQVRGAIIASVEPDDVVFWGIGAELGDIQPAVITEGRWLSASGQNEMVLTRWMAQSSNLDIGDTVEATTANASAALTVVGIAVDTSFFPYPQSRPGVVFVTEDTVHHLIGGSVRDLTPDMQGERRADFTFGVRIQNPESAGEFAADARNLVGDALYYDRTWLAIRDTVAEINESPVIILRVFSFFGLLGAGVIVASAITGYVLMQTRDVGVLKASGFGPRHVATLFLGQQLTLGMLAAVTGVVAAVLMTPLVLSVVGEILYSGVPVEFDLARMAAVVLTTIVVIVVFTLVPAWKAGRVSTLAALTSRGRGAASSPSRLARIAMRLHVPYVAVFGIKDIFARKTRAWLTVAAVAVVAAVSMMTLTLFTMFDRFMTEPETMGAWPFELRVERLGEFGTSEASTGYLAAGTTDPISQEDLMALIDSHSEVEASVRSWEMQARVKELDLYFRTFLLDGPTNEVGFHLTDGRMISGPGEAVIGLGMAQTFDLKVGDTVTGLLPLGGPKPTEVTVKIVGVYVLGENLGRVWMMSANALLGLDRETGDNDEMPPGAINLKLAEGVDADEFSKTLAAETGNRIMVANLRERFEKGIEDVRSLIPLMFTLNGILIALAAMNLLISLTFAVQERTREFGILKTTGFTPRQIVAVVVTGATTLAVIGVAIGAPIGYILTRIWILYGADIDGLPGSEVVQVPSAPWIALMVPLAVGLAALGAALPARRAAGTVVSRAFRFE